MNKITLLNNILCVGDSFGTTLGYCEDDIDVWPEPVFVYVYEAQEPIPGVHKRLQIRAPMIFLQMFSYQRSILKIQKSVVPVCILPRTKAFVNFPLK
jgi:hypothetical protein